MTLLVYGANGYTGTLVAERAAAGGGRAARGRDGRAGAALERRASGLLSRCAGRRRPGDGGSERGAELRRPLRANRATIGLGVSAGPGPLSGRDRRARRLRGA